MLSELVQNNVAIRLLTFNHVLHNIKSWVSVHLVRHKIGIEHFITTQRTDRTGVNRDEARQDKPVNHRIVANAQAIITISRKRLCRQASRETKDAWKEFLGYVAAEDPTLVSVCVPDCIYRGHCYEMEPCGFSETRAYEEQLKAYRS